MKLDVSEKRQSEILDMIRESIVDIINERVFGEKKPSKSKTARAFMNIAQGNEDRISRQRIIGTTDGLDPLGRKMEDIIEYQINPYINIIIYNVVVDPQYYNIEESDYNVHYHYFSTDLTSNNCKHTLYFAANIFFKAMTIYAFDKRLPYFCDIIEEFKRCFGNFTKLLPYSIYVGPLDMKIFRKATNFKTINEFCITRFCQTLMIRIIDFINKAFADDPLDSNMVKTFYKDYINTNGFSYTPSDMTSTVIDDEYRDILYNQSVFPSDKD